MKKLTIILYGFLFCSLLAVKAFSQTANADDADYIKRVIEGKNFAFTPAYVIPLTGSSQPLTGGVGLTFNGTELTAALPYVGQAYNAGPGTTTNSTIQFSSTNFEYKVTESKKGKFEITFRPKTLTPSGLTDPTKLSLTVSPDGTAALRVISNNRQPITYTGHILRATL